MTIILAKQLLASYDFRAIGKYWSCCVNEGEFTDLFVKQYSYKKPSNFRENIVDMKQNKIIQKKEFIDFYEPLLKGYSESFKQDTESNSFSLQISAKKHGFGKTPQIITLIKKNGQYEEIVVDKHTDNQGNIVIKTNEKFEGRVVIK